MVVRTGTVAEGHQLSLGVLGKLAMQRRILGRHAVARRAMAGGTGWHTLARDAAPIDVATQLHGFGIVGGRGLELLRGEEGSHVDHVLRAELGGKGPHHGIDAGRRLVALTGRKVLELLADVFRMLTRQLGVLGNLAVAVCAVTRGTDFLDRFLAGLEVRLERAFFLGGLLGHERAGGAQHQPGSQAGQRTRPQVLGQPQGNARHFRRRCRLSAITGILHAQSRCHRSCRPHVPIDLLVASSGSPKHSDDGRTNRCA